MPFGMLLRPHYRVEAWVRADREDFEDELTTSLENFFRSIGLDVNGTVVFRVFPDSDYI